MYMSAQESTSLTCRQVKATAGRQPFERVAAAGLNKGSLMRSITPLTKLIAATTLITVGMIPAATATATKVPTPPGTGCPTGYLLLSVDDLNDLGHMLWPELDANADGHICGKPLAPPVQEQFCATLPGGVCTVPTIYYLRDNNVTRR